MDENEILENNPDENSSWEMHLTIYNNTDEVLTASSNSLDYGKWYRVQHEGWQPVDIQPGKSEEAFGIIARSGPVGYEATATWKLQSSAGEFRMHIDVPYSSSNSSSLDSSGLLQVTGWSNLPSGGHNFSRSITVSKIG